MSVTFDDDNESDPGPYPIPPDAPIEDGADSDGDRHILVVDHGNCILYELFYAFPQADGSWQARSGAMFDLNSNALQPDGWTSADAAGLPILPGLVRYDEVAEGEIRHALRFTAPQTRKAYIWPTRHYASELTVERWNNDVLAELHQIQGVNFEAVAGSSLMIEPDSGRVRSP